VKIAGSFGSPFVFSRRRNRASTGFVAGVNLQVRTEVGGIGSFDADSRRRSHCAGGGPGCPGMAEEEGGREGIAEEKARRRLRFRHPRPITWP
jgi:hypothetical protein